MEFRKNDLVTLEIEDCGIDGEGIGKADGFTVFVKDAVIGDTVTAKIIKAKKNYGYGRLMEVLKPSPYRVEPKCEFARQCGGCQLQALSYDQQLVFKTNKVKGHLERIGGFTDIPMEPIIGMDELFHYRNKAQFPVGRNKEGKIVTGFYAGRTHNIIENRDCALGVAENKEVLDRVIAHMEKYGIEPYNEATGKGLVRHVLIRYGYFTKEVMVCLILNGNKIPKEEQLVKSLCEIPGMTSITINVNKKHSNVILGEEIRPPPRPAARPVSPPPPGHDRGLPPPGSVGPQRQRAVLRRDAGLHLPRRDAARPFLYRHGGRAGFPRSLPPEPETGHRSLRSHQRIPQNLRSAQSPAPDHPWTATESKNSRMNCL